MPKKMHYPHVGMTRLSADVWKRLNAYAARRGVSNAAAIRELVTKALETQ